MASVHVCCYEQRRARMLSESWHQLFSIPTSASHLSFPLLTYWKQSLLLSWDNEQIIQRYWMGGVQYGGELLNATYCFTFHEFMVLCCIFHAGLVLCCLLCFGSFWRKMGAVRRNWGTIFNIYNVLVTIQRSHRGLSI